MSTTERLRQWQAGRRQTTDDVIARYAAQSGVSQARTPLTTGQHILHLLLTVFTAGLWLPVWIIRASQGNRA